MPRSLTGPGRGDISASQISLSLVYSSIAKNFLLFTLAVWGVKDAPPPSSNTEETSLLAYLDLETLPRQWIINNGLGGMTAGFGLRGKGLPHSSPVPPLSKPPSHFGSDT
jgi:hypothetical protein